MGLMQITYNQVQLQPFLEQQHVPVDVIDRGPAASLWVVSMSPLTTAEDTPPVFVHVKTGELVTVPMVPYIVRSHPAKAYGFLMGIGLRAGMALAKTDLGKKYDIEQVHLALGDVVEQLDGAVRFYGGFAARLRNR
jgi:hypothetical protein